MNTMKIVCGLNIQLLKALNGKKELWFLFAENDSRLHLQQAQPKGQ